MEGWARPFMTWFTSRRFPGVGVVKWFTLACCFAWLSLVGGTASAQKFDGLAQTPPMGWNSWNKFACDVNEQLIRETADAMVASGLKDAGYQYVNIDDCWQGERDARGFIQPDPKRFPSGMKALADYVHSRGLKFGLYSDAGWQTCGGRPGSRGYEFQDALTYAEWGVDYLKYDWCKTEGLKAEGAYQTMSEALRKAGRPIVFSLCEWGGSKPWTWAKSVGHLWRTTGDIFNCFDCIEEHGDWKSFGVMQILDMQRGVREHAGPGHWNDPDMLEVGNGMPVNQDRAHFSAWAMLAAPLIAGNDLRSMSKQTLAVLANREVIAVNQDALGVQGFRQAVRDGVEFWFKPLQGGDWAFMALNRQKQPRRVSFDWKAEDMRDDLARRDPAFAKQRYRVRDLWAARRTGDTSKPLDVTVPAQDVLMLRLTPM
jgi:alpha-galactosidase